MGFSAAEAAAAVGVSEWLIYEEMKIGNIGYMQLRGHKVIPRWSLEDHLKKHEKPAREVVT